MSESTSEGPPASLMLPKCPTGIAGLDQITGGGLPRGRPTLVGLQLRPPFPLPPG